MRTGKLLLRLNLLSDQTLAGNFSADVLRVWTDGMGRFAAPQPLPPLWLMAVRSRNGQFWVRNRLSGAVASVVGCLQRNPASPNATRYPIDTSSR